MINKDIETQKERLLEMYMKDLITYEELLYYLERLEGGSLKEPPTIY